MNEHKRLNFVSNKNKAYGGYASGTGLGIGHAGGLGGHATGLGLGIGSAHGNSAHGLGLGHGHAVGVGR